MAKLTKEEQRRWGEHIAEGGSGDNTPLTLKTVRLLVCNAASGWELDRGFDQEDLRAITEHCNRTLKEQKEAENDIATYIDNRYL